jgi:hypothetical protein
VRFDKRDAAAAEEATRSGAAVVGGAYAGGGGNAVQTALPAGDDVHASFEASLPGWVLESAQTRCWYALKERHPILSAWFVYDEAAPRVVRSGLVYVNAMWVMALKALLFYLTFPPTLLAACAEHKVSRPYLRLSNSTLPH